MPNVSVVMPVFNAERYVAAAIESILGQTFRDFELLIINDGSTDSSLEIINRYRDLRIQIRSRENLGIVATRNELLEWSRGSLIACMDADDVSHRERLEIQLKFLQQNPGVGVVGTFGKFIDPDGDELSDFHDLLTHDEITAALLRADLGIINPSAMIRRSAIMHVGGYRTRFVQAEDLDLWLRIGESYRLENIPRVLINYRVHPKSISHALPGEQRRSAQLVVNEALARRGESSVFALNLNAPTETACERQRKWAWWAYGAGNFKTAFKYTYRLVLNEPFELKNWHLLAVLFKKSCIEKRIIWRKNANSA